jgi:hypothetical protein
MDKRTSALIPFIPILGRNSLIEMASTNAYDCIDYGMYINSIEYHVTWTANTEQEEERTTLKSLGHPFPTYKSP